MNINREVTYNWKSQVLLLIGALLINVMLVSGVKADGPPKEKDIDDTKVGRTVGFWEPARLMDTKEDTRKKIQLGVEELTKAINAEEEDFKRFKARMSSSETKEMIKILQEVNREVNRMSISRGA